MNKIYAVKLKDRDVWVGRRGYQNKFREARFYGTKNGPTQIIRNKRNPKDLEIKEYLVVENKTVDILKLALATGMLDDLLTVYGRHVLSELCS